MLALPPAEALGTSQSRHSQDTQQPHSPSHVPQHHGARADAAARVRTNRQEVPPATASPGPAAAAEFPLPSPPPTLALPTSPKSAHSSSTSNAISSMDQANPPARSPHVPLLQRATKPPLRVQAQERDAAVGVPRAFNAVHMCVLRVCLCANTRSRSCSSTCACMSEGWRDAGVGRVACVTR